MKFLIVVAFVATIAAVNAAATLTEEQKAKAKQYLAECKEDFKITDEDIVKLRTTDYADASEDVKCFANCFLEKAGVVKDGALQEAVALEKFTPNIGEEKANEILNLCRGEVSDNKCETAFKLYSCLKQNKAILE